MFVASDSRDEQHWCSRATVLNSARRGIRYERSTCCSDCLSPLRYAEAASQGIRELPTAILRSVAMQSRNAGQKEAVELAVTVLQGYLAMARQAGDQYYSEWFLRVLHHHEEESEVLNDQDKQEDPPRSFPSMRRCSEPPRADRESE